MISRSELEPQRQTENRNERRSSVDVRSHPACIETYFSAFRRAAQYFFIRALTAFFCAADIFERLRLGSRASATPRADFAMVRRAAFEIVARSGKVFSKAAASVWSSFQRASAPRRAHLRMSVECFAIPPMVCRFAEEVQTWHPACSMTASIARSPICGTTNITSPRYGRRHWPPGTSISGNTNTSMSCLYDRSLLSPAVARISRRQSTRQRPHSVLIVLLADVLSSSSPGVHVAPCPTRTSVNGSV